MMYGWWEDQSLMADYSSKTSETRRKGHLTFQVLRAKDCEMRISIWWECPSWVEEECRHFPRGKTKTNITNKSTLKEQLKEWVLGNKFWNSKVSTKKNICRGNTYGNYIEIMEIKRNLNESEVSTLHMQGQHVGRGGCVWNTCIITPRTLRKLHTVT